MLKHKRVLSFKYAFEGLWVAFKEEANLRIQFFIGAVGLCLAAYYRISQIEWILCIIAFGLVVSMELINTAIEEMVDYFIPERHFFAKKIKDISAAAVLVFFLTELIIGGIILLPYILRTHT